MSNLKPCPFCGSKATLRGGNGGASWIICDNDTCRATQGIGVTDFDAIKLWNTRPAEDALKAEVERLKDALLNIKNRLFERTYLHFGEAAVADWVVRKVNETLGKDTNAPTKESEGKDE